MIDLLMAICIIGLCIKIDFMRSRIEKLERNQKED